MVVLVGLLLAGPGLILGTPPTDSAVYNRTWSEQFSRLFASGVLWPRWLPDSFSGFGSPTFFFYAPLPFWIAAVLDLLTLGRLPNNVLLGLLGAVLFVASGLTMRAWMLRLTNPTRATVAALLYMAAPFHLFDHYSRGALGELVVYAVLPIVVSGLHDALRGRRGGVALLACGVALLLLSHLPVSVPVVLLLLPCQAIGFLPGRRADAIAAAGLRVVLGGLLGLALSAAYILPALSMRGHISMEDMHIGYYSVRSWLLTSFELWPLPMLQLFVVSLAAAYGLAAAAVLFSQKRSGGERAPLVWATTALLLLVVMAGVVPWVWDPWSPMALIQFPWRLLGPIEFSLITAVVLAFRSTTAPWRMMVAWFVAVAAVPAVGVAIGFALTRYDVARDADWRNSDARIARTYLDAAEYLPAGARPHGQFDALSRDGSHEQLVAPYRDRPAAWSEPDGTAVLAIATDQRGAGELVVEAQAPTRIVLRRFHYPLWKLEDGTGHAAPTLVPHGPARLLAFDVPAGTSRLRLVWSPPPIVALGSAVSTFAILVWAFLLLRPARAG